MQLFKPLPYIPDEPLPTKFPPGFVIVPKPVVDAMPQIRPSGVAVYVALGKYADNDTGHTFPGIRTIATDAGIDPKTVGPAIDRLEAAGLIRTEKKSRTVTHYWLL